MQSRDILRELVNKKWLVDFTEIDPAQLAFTGEGFSHVLEHPKLRTISLPYEWSFALLRDAALFHLDLHLYLLDRDFTLSDASAYNIQFIGPSPIFIDHLSIRSYREGEFWLGHRQFCEQFLNPLLLRAYLDIPHNSWYRGNLEGIPQTEFARLLPLKRKFSWNVLTNVVLPAGFQQGSTSEKNATFSVANRKLPKAGLIGMLSQLRGWIKRLQPANAAATTWSNYATTTTYDDAETSSKREFVAEFVKQAKPSILIDLGCNTGDYSKLALENGAAAVLGFDFDQQALDKSLARAKAEHLDFLPLYLDAKNPSPNQGWMQAERYGFSERFSGDAVLALAFEHHLAIAHNIPLDQVVAWITAMAPAGIIEFVPKSDPTIQKMLALREDIFNAYHVDAFETQLSAKRRIVRKRQVSASGRVLYEFGQLSA